jgi:hypothetical protein
MNKYDAKKMAKIIKFGKGIIRTKKDAVDYIKFGYNPNKLLFNFTVLDNDALQYILAKMEMTKIKLN